MNYRLNTILERTSYTADTTEIIDLDFNSQCSNIVIGLEAVNSSATQTAHPMAILTKIEIVDGSDVLWSLDGYEAEALDWYDNMGKFRSNYNYALSGGSECRYVGINFGRYLFDEIFAFDPAKFTNPRLRIGLDIDAGANAPATVYLTVWANLFDEKTISPQGFFTAKEIKEYTIAASTHNYTDMPTDYPYRGIYLRPFVAGTEPNQVVSNFKLSEDQDKRVPYDHGIQDIERTLLNMYPAVEEHYYFTAGTSTTYLYVAPTTRVTAFCQEWAAAAGTHSFAQYNGDGGKLNVITDSGSANVQVYVRGYVPHCVYEIPTGDKLTQGDWFDPRGLGKLRADITGAASATGYLFAQQFRSY